MAAELTERVARNIPGSGGKGMSDASTGKVVVNRSMSLDGFIACPDHAMNWIFDVVTPALPHRGRWSFRTTDLRLVRAKRKPWSRGLSRPNRVPLSVVESL